VDVLEWRSTTKLPRAADVDGAAIHRLSRRDATARNLLPISRLRTVDAFFARGDQGYVVTVGDRFAGWIWLSRVSHRDPYSGLRIQIAPDEAYAYAMRVEPGFRHLGIAAVLVSTLLSDAQNDPTIGRVYGWVDSGNREMQALLRMMFGFTQAQRVRRVRLTRMVWQMPWYDNPKFGPVSSVGRHSTATSPADPEPSQRATLGDVGEHSAP
jgi:ribosomal protein S18 acetylase RimI-like enzyme